MDLSSFLPEEGADINEYLKDTPAPGTKKPKKKAESKPAEVAAPRAFPELNNLNTKAFGEVVEQQRKLAAPKHLLGLESDTDAVLDADQINSRTGAYSYDMGTLFKRNALSGSLKHFEDIHDLHNHVEDALDMHMQHAMARGDHGTVAQLDSVGGILAESHRHLDKAMQNHMSGMAESTVKGNIGNRVTVPGAIQGLGNSVRALGQAAKKLSDITDGKYNPGHVLDAARNIHADYVGDHANILMSGEQIKVEEAAKIKGATDSVERETRPPQTIAPEATETLEDAKARTARINAASFPNALQDPSARVIRSVVPLYGRMSDSEVARLQEPKAEPESKPSDTTDTPLPGFEKQTTEISPEEGKAASIARTQRSADEAEAYKINANVDAYRERRRANIKQRLSLVQAPEMLEADVNPAGLPRESVNKLQAAEIRRQNAVTPMSETRLAAFTTQQALAKAATERSREEETKRVQVAQARKEKLIQADHDVINNHLRDGNILQAAVEHFNRLGPSRIDNIGERVNYRPGLKSTRKFQARILKDPHAYLRKEGYSVGYPERPPQPVESKAPQKQPKLNITGNVATDTGGEVVSRAKLNRRATSSGYSGTPTTSTTPAPKETKAKRNQAFVDARKDFNQVMGAPRED